MPVAKVEPFFRAAAGLDIDNADLKRYNDFINKNIHDLLIRGEAAAKAHGRDIIQPSDLPITKGLQECIHQFRELDEEIELKPVLEQLAGLPPLDLAVSTDTEERLPVSVRGLSLALARSFTIVHPGLKNPQSEHWECAIQLFSLLL